MELIREFGKLGRHDAGIAGGKGASLGEMTQAGIPVPPGFVVLSSAFERFLEETDLNVEIDSILHGVDTKAMHTIEHASETIQKLILEATMPEDIKVLIQTSFQELGTTFVAVRSSATAEDSASAAWAGQLDSFLNTTEATLLENVQRCWASLFTPRAIFYRFEQGLHESKISVAVVVQKMVESEVSGIAFSVHPVTEDRNQLIIEAGFGLGEAIVSGQVTPDSYVVGKSPREIIDINVSTQNRALYRVGEAGGNEWRDIPEPKASSQVLTEAQVLELSELIIHIENHYGFPCDIEWAYEARPNAEGERVGKFYIVQSRPITTLSNEEDLNAYRGELTQKKKEIVLSKYMSREHSMFYAHVWNESNRDYFDEYIPDTNIKNMLFVRNERGVLDVYYDLDELKIIFDRIVKGIIDNPSILDTVIGDFYTHWKELLPYLNDEKRISSLEDLKSFYMHYMRWWGPMAYIFVIPDRKGMPEDLRVKALKMREETQEYSDEGDRVYLEYITRTLPNLGQIAHLMTPEEVYRGETLSPEEIAEIEHRNSGCGLLTILGNTHFSPTAVTGEVLKEFGIQLASLEVGDSREIKGASASTGKVQGKVKVVLVKADLAHVAEGDIMVTYATSPDYVPAMKKCSGIVTDEGGVVCHAAIVSRELGIPCVVGTKIATQVLKDGDLVEVDADNGVVRVVERVTEGSTDKDASGTMDLSDRYVSLVNGRKLYPPLNGYSAFLQGSEYNIQKYYKKWYEDKVKLDLFIYMRQGFSQVWLPEDDIRFASKFAFKEYLNTPELFICRQRHLEDGIRKIDEIYSLYTYEKISNSNWDDLLQLVNVVRDTIWDVNAAVIFTIYLDKQLCSDVLIEEQYEMTQESLDSLWERAVEPMFESFDKAQTNHFLRLTKDRIAWDAVVQECQYIFADYYSAKTLSEVEDALKKRYSKYIDEPGIASRELLAEEEKISSMIERHSQWMSSLSETESKIAQYLQITMMIRDRRKNFFAKGMTIIYRVAERMFTETGVALELIPFYTVHELLKGREHLESTHNDLMSRKNGFQWLVPYVGEVCGVNGDISVVSEKVNKYFENCHASVQDTSVIQGQSGFRGVIRGKVRLILNANKGGGFCDGEILVAGMTRPEYVPLMKRASAIITDEGGITCHAAIVSRELKIPCVIGTRIATKVLKDGDLVEVDADNGVVRVLEKAK